MTKKELLERFEKENIPQKGIYSFDKGKWGEEFILSHPAPNVWKINYYERGEYYLLAEFQTETEACEYFYQRVKNYGKSFKGDR